MTTSSFEESRRLAAAGSRCGTLMGHRDHLRLNTNDCKECAAELRRLRKQVGVLRASPAERADARSRCEDHCSACGYYIPHGQEHLTADGLIAHPWCHLTGLGVPHRQISVHLTRTEHARLHLQVAAQAGGAEVKVEFAYDDFVMLTAECSECDWRVDGETEDGESTITTNYDDDFEEGELTRRELTDAMTRLVAGHTAGHEKHRAGKPAVPLPEPIGPPPRWATDDGMLTVEVRLADD